MNSEDTFLDTQFAAYRNELLPDVTPVGPDAVRTTVRRRRRVTVTVGAAIALALIAGPAVGYSALNRAPAPPEPGTSPEPTQDSPPSSSPSAAPPGSATATTPNGRISRTDLLAARLPMPPWSGDAPCYDEWFADTKPAQVGNWLESVDYADVDRDGTEEAVAMIGCKYNTVIQTQVAVFKRNQSGNIVLLGQVLTSRPLGWIFQIDAQPDGSIRIEVGDREPTDEQVASVVVRQWRTYGWTGTTFQQTAGPTSFPPNPTLADLRVTATDIIYAAPADDGSRHGTTTVTIRNAGPAAAQYVWLSLELGANVRHEGAGWSGCVEASSNPGSSPPNLGCLLGPMRAGETKTLVLGVASPGAVLTQFSARAAVMCLDKQRDPVPDAKPSDNEAHFEQR